MADEEKKKAGDESVMKRANRLARARLKPLAEALGLPSDFKTEHVEQIAKELKAQKDNAMTAEEKNKAAEQRRDAEVRDLREKLDQAAVKLLKVEKERDAALAAKTDLEEQLQVAAADAEVAIAAAQVGLADPEYGKTLLRRKINSLGENEQVPNDFAKTFFEELKKDPTKKALFVDPLVVMAGPPKEPPKEPPPVKVNEAPNADGPKKPAEPPPAEKVDVTKMSKADFSKHMRSAYNYVQGT